MLTLGVTGQKLGGVTGAALKKLGKPRSKHWAAAWQKMAEMAEIGRWSWEWEGWHVVLAGQGHKGFLVEDYAI